MPAIPVGDDGGCRQGDLATGGVPLGVTRPSITLTYAAAFSSRTEGASPAALPRRRGAIPV